MIEVALPLEAINKASAHEKSVPRRGHPATLHLWWARRPLATVRAVLFSQLVDDPSARPDEFPTEAAQKIERERLHTIIAKLVEWENTNDASVLADARAEIKKSTGSNPPFIVDPFAGGGSIPLEAQRLGLQVQASDLNPVAVLINKALVEFPPKFAAREPVYPGLAGSEITEWTGAHGIAADVRAYGERLRDQAFRRLGHLYPKVDLPNGVQANVIACIWGRTVTCPNPACRIKAPLVRSWWLSKKKGRETFIVPHSPVGDSKDVTFTIRSGPGQPVRATMSGRTGGSCIACESVISKEYVKSEALAGRMSQTLLAVVAEGDRRRIYLEPSDEQVKAADVEAPADVPDQELGIDPRNLWTPAYGLSTFSSLFTNRQLVTLTTLSDLIAEGREVIQRDASAAGMDLGDRLEKGGAGAAAYADVVTVYLGFLMSKLADWLSAVCSWIPQIEGVRDTFARQAIPMAWDYVEINPFSNAVGNINGHIKWIADAVEQLPALGSANVSQRSATKVTWAGGLVSTDPPYYDNIAYSDLSDFLYVWERRTLKEVLPELFGTLLVPKADELVANPYRHGGRDAARKFFEAGFEEVFTNARENALADYPMTVYYAFKQTETSDEGAVSSGWQTLLDGMVRAGWTITATWPMRSERTARMIAVGHNALASSIVLALRPRPKTAPTQDRSGFIAVMKAELGDSVTTLQAGGVAPVDLPQAAIGPGMAVFSRYSAVLEPDGSPMTVRAALSLINEMLDEVLTEQEGDFDSTTRFAIAWFRTQGYGEGDFGDADNLARARNSSVATLEREGILTGRKGVVRLFRPSDMADDYDVITDESVSTWEVLHHLIRIMESEGIPSVGSFLAQASARGDSAIDIDLIPELSHLLFRIAEDNKWMKDAISFNSLVTAWPDIIDASRAPRSDARQGALDFAGDE
ncbi:hypothetical protein CRM90_29020 [Mycobacterium sp. ENV421]|nr:DUF1156 domain-containing protein [Mycobacterium sp. ENV421]PND54236.1 hypothetical protein CRM90_29020 [Mycobacterium sp. ENV421]